MRKEISFFIFFRVLSFDEEELFLRKIPVEGGSLELVLVVESAHASEPPDSTTPV